MRLHINFTFSFIFHIYCITLFSCRVLNDELLNYELSDGHFIEEKMNINYKIIPKTALIYKRKLSFIT